MRTASLLPPDFGAERDELVFNLGVGYSASLRQPMANFRIWKASQDALVSAIRTRYAALGLEAAPWQEAALWARIDLPAPAVDADAHLRLLRALLTDFTEPFWRQFEYRLAHGGNVHLHAVGPTGLGKSSCLITIGDTVKTAGPGPLAGHLAFDPTELPDRLRDKERGDFVLLDENLAVSGEGSRTIQQMVGNLEDTLRASQRHLFTASPTLDETGTTQAQLEALLWNPRDAWTLCLVWIRGVPHGVVGIKWAPAHLYAEYAPWKAANVERTLQAQFNDPSFYARLALRACEDATFQAWFARKKAKYSVNDFDTGLKLAKLPMLSGEQRSSLAGFMHAALTSWDDFGAALMQSMKLEVPPSMKLIAKRCRADG